MSVYLLPMTTVKKLDQIRRTFFGKGGTKRKYHLLKWEIICKSKRKGGLGVKDLKKMNISLLCKWWWKLEKEEGLWQTIVKHRYFRKDNIYSVSHKLNDSSIWYDLLKIKDVYLLGRDVCIKNGCQTRFWSYILSLCVFQILSSLNYVNAKMSLLRKLEVVRFILHLGDGFR